MGSEAYWITPDVAQFWWDHRDVNRRCAERRVKEFAALYRSGDWVPTRQPIIFHDRILVDGQHRILGVIEAGVAAPHVIAYGDEPSRLQDLAPYHGPFQIKSIDTGRSRSVRDAISIARKRDNKRILSQIEIGVVGFVGRQILGKSPVPLRLMEWLVDFMDTDLRCVGSMFSTHVVGLRKACVASAFCLFHVGTDTQVQGLARAYISGANLDIDSPIYRLRELALRSRISGHKVEKDTFLRACNAIEQALAGKSCRGLFATLRPAISSIDRYGFGPDRADWTVGGES